MSYRAPATALIAAFGLAATVIGATWAASPASGSSRADAGLQPNLVTAEPSADQDVPTQRGVTYRLSFGFVAQRESSGGPAAVDVTFGTTTMSVAAPRLVTNGNARATLDAVATGPSTRLTFADPAGRDELTGAATRVTEVEVHRLG